MRDYLEVAFDLMIFLLLTLSNLYFQYYNNMDVLGFVMGIEKLRALYQKLNLCLTDDGVSLSALAYKFLHRSAVPKNPILWLPRKHEKFVFDLVEKCIIGKFGCC